MPVSACPALDELKADIEDFEAKWLVYEQFNDELNAFAVEEWIVFRYDGN